MAALGKYQDLPLPEEWIPALEGFQKSEIYLGPPDEVINPAALVDELLSGLKASRMEVLWRRFALGQTLEEIGFAFNCTRERIRQIESKSLKHILGLGKRQFLQSLTAFSDVLPRHFQVLPSLSVVMPEANSTELFFFLSHLSDAILLSNLPKNLRKIAPRSEVLRTSQGFIICDATSREVLEADFHSRGQVLTIEQWSEATGSSQKALLTCVNHSVFLRLSRNGKIISSRWTIPQWLEVVAWDLAENGFIEWHFSEIAKALSYVNPEEFTDILPRNIAAVLARPELKTFQWAGTKGRWVLSELGDGHEDNKAAITALLQDSNVPLHYSVIFKRIGRNIKEGTVHVMLSREANFIGFGNGVFGLPGKLYETDIFEEKWICDLLSNSPYLLENRVSELAKRDDVDIGTVRSISAISKNFRYVKGFDNPPSYQSFPFFSSRRMHRWYNWPESTALPDTDILLEGTRHAFEQDDYTTILKIKAALEESGREILEDFHDYFFVAENSV